MYYAIKLNAAFFLKYIQTIHAKETVEMSQLSDKMAMCCMYSLLKVKIRAVFQAH